MGNRWKTNFPGYRLMPPTLKNVDVRVCLAVIVKTPEVEKNRRQKRGKRGDIIWLAHAIIALVTEWM